MNEVHLILITSTMLDIGDWNLLIKKYFKSSLLDNFRIEFLEYRSLIKIIAIPFKGIPCREIKQNKFLIFYL